MFLGTQVDFLCLLSSRFRAPFASSATEASPPLEGIQERTVLRTSKHMFMLRRSTKFYTVAIAAVVRCWAASEIASAYQVDFVDSEGVSPQQLDRDS